jgi:hypothetical protein
MHNTRGHNNSRCSYGEHNRRGAPRPARRLQLVSPRKAVIRHGVNKRRVFLVELLICGILTIFFLFYFNRLFATVVSYGIRAYTWRTFHAYIDITSLQISLLGGRVFFKDIRYHGHNETILVHGGHIPATGIAAARPVRPRPARAAAARTSTRQRRAASRRPSRYHAASPSRSRASRPSCTTAAPHTTASSRPCDARRAIPKRSLATDHMPTPTWSPRTKSGPTIS